MLNVLANHSVYLRQTINSRYPLWLAKKAKPFHYCFGIWIGWNECFISVSISGLFQL